MKTRALTYLVPMALLAISSLAVAQTELTYENWAQGFFTHNCLGCHNSSLTGEDRFGAPDTANFDTLELIRGQLPIIRDAVSGEDPYMPPNGVVWWWDRVSLAEWIDAGAPGESDTLAPIEREDAPDSISYQSLRFHFSEPEDEQFDVRYISVQPEWEEEFEGTVLDRRLYITRQGDGSVVMTRSVWFVRNDDWSETTTRVIEYTPSIPILFADPVNPGETWESAVAARELFWDGWPDETPDSDSTRQENWAVTNRGMETIDNGVVLPINALKMELANRTADATTTYWFGLGMGVVRRELDAPSALPGYIHEVTREMSVFTTQYPMYGPFTVESASQEWLPFVGPYYSEENEYYGYDYDLEIQNLQVASLQPDATAEPTATLAPDPVDPTAVPTPTATLFPPGLPPEGESTPTPTSTLAMEPSPTPTQTQAGGGPSPTPDPDDPRNYDHNEDNSVDSLDLLMFLQHWKMEMGGSSK